MKYSIRILFLFYICNSSLIYGNDLRSKIDSINSIQQEHIVSNLKKSIEIFSNNVEQANSIGYEYGKAKALEKLSLAYYLSGQYQNSTEAIFGAIKIYEKQNWQKELALIYGLYGYQVKRRDLDRGKNFIQHGIQIAEKNNLDTVLVTLYDNYGVLLEMQNNLDSAMYFYNKSLHLKYKLNDIPGIPYSLNNIAGIYAQKKDYDRSFSFMKESDAYRVKENGDYGRAENLVMWGDILSHKGDTDAAIKKFKEGIKISEKINYTPIIQYCLEQLSIIYEKKKDYLNAYNYFKNYTAVRDSLNSKETKIKIAELEINYETEKKDRLLAETELKIKQTNQQLFLLGGIIILLVIFSALIYYFQKQKRKRIQQEHELKDLLKQSEMKKKVADEKLRISRELHDNLGAQLTFLISSIDNLTFSPHFNNQEGDKKLKEIGSFARITMTELRNTIWIMKHEDADINQLIYKLNELKHRINSNIGNIYVEISNCVESQVQLNTATVLNLYRIIQEALQNVIKHSNATRVDIIFSETSDKIVLQIIDNGEGFNIDMPAFGNGLVNMKSRCEEAGGEFTVESSNNGTIINCVLAK